MNLHCILNKNPFLLTEQLSNGLAFMEPILTLRTSRFISDAPINPLYFTVKAIGALFPTSDCPVFFVFEASVLPFYKNGTGVSTTFNTKNVRGCTTKKLPTKLTTSLN